MTKKDPFPFETSPNFWMYQVRIKSDAALRQAFQHAGNDMPPEQWSILARLYEEEGMNQCRLGQKTLKDRHNITRILDRLEKKGLIERRKCTGDNRSFRIHLTQDGRRLERKLSRVASAHAEKKYKGISRKDLLILRRVLDKISSNLDRCLSCRK